MFLMQDDVSVYAITISSHVINKEAIWGKVTLFLRYYKTFLQLSQIFNSILTTNVHIILSIRKKQLFMYFLYVKPIVYRLFLSSSNSQRTLLTLLQLFHYQSELAILTHQNISMLGEQKKGQIKMICPREFTLSNVNATQMLQFLT